MNTPTNTPVLLGFPKVWGFCFGKPRVMEISAFLLEIFIIISLIVEFWERFFLNQIYNLLFSFYHFIIFLENEERGYKICYASFHLKILNLTKEKQL